jgi:hypothetical protein
MKTEILSSRLAILALYSSLLISCLIATPLNSLAADQNGKIQRKATWQWPDAPSLEDKIDQWMTERSIPEEKQLEILRIWVDPTVPVSGPATLDRLLTLMSAIDPRVTEALKTLEPSTELAKAPDLSWMDSSLPSWAQDTVRLAIGRGLAQRRWYDEALVFLESLSLENSVDPASLLFYRGACFHHLLRKEDCLQQLETLMERETEIPTRYAVTSKLMLADMQPLKTDSLDEVSRLMKDVSRRLDLGRAGKRTLDGEQQVIEKLDKLIEDIEQQMQQQQQQQQSSSEQQQNSSDKQAGQPQEDSRVAGETGPGDVDQKKLADKNGWGNLPPAERQEALQRITKDLPSHYREAIQEYFRKLATKPKE